MTWIYLLILFSAGADVRCGEGLAEWQGYSWCANQNPKSRDVLYVFHGGGGTSRDFIEDARVRALWKTMFGLNGKEMPSIVAFSFGPRWLLGDLEELFPTTMRSLENAAKIIMPALEAEVGFKRGRRMAYGWSMGSYNAAVLALRYPKLFHSVALQCPAVGLCDPFAAPEIIEAYAKSLPAGTRPENVTGVAGWIRDEFRTRRDWARHDPTQLVKRAKTIRTRFFLSCTRDDEYGFYPGAENFVSLLREKNAHVEWHPEESGGHCAESLATQIAKVDFFCK